MREAGGAGWIGELEEDGGNIRGRFQKAPRTGHNFLLQQRYPYFSHGKTEVHRAHLHCSDRPSVSLVQSMVSLKPAA